MRERLHGILLTVAAGAALIGLHALAGLMLTPFFGATPLFWATVVVSCPLSLSLGLLAGQPVARAAARRPELPSLIGALAGLLVLVVPVVLAPLSRRVLDRDPDSLIAAPLAILVLITLPSATGAAALPGIVERARSRSRAASGGTSASGRTSSSGGSGSGTGSRSSGPSARLAAPPAALGAPGIPLLLFSLGGIAGIAACAPLLLDPTAGRVWTPLWVLGGALLAASVAGLRPLLGAIAIAAAAALVPVFLARPNEIRDFEFEKAMKHAWKLRVGKYYLDTAGRRVLDRSEIARQYAALHDRIAYASDKSVAAVLIADTLRGMGAIKFTGDGLREIFEIYLPSWSKTRIMNLVDKIETVRSDGKGEIAFTLRRMAPDEEVEVTLENGKGEPTTFVFESDFTLSLHVEQGRDETRTTMDFGPVEVEKAGLFGANDTYKTPVVIKNASFVFDAHLLGFTIVSSKQKVVVTARAQGSIGSVKTEILQIVDLATPAATSAAAPRE